MSKEMQRPGNCDGNEVLTTSLTPPVLQRFLDPAQIISTERYGHERRRETQRG
jgi:hypothetical protein